MSAPTQVTLDRCRSCGAPIRWGVTVKGHRMPINPEPAADGNLVFDDEVNVRVALPREPADRPRYVAHFATCPNASAHRRRGRDRR